MMSGIKVQVSGLTKTYVKGGASITVLDDVDVSMNAGDVVAVVGPSGSGKSSFLHVMGMLDQPTLGTVHLDGVNVFAQPERKRDRLRNRRVGFVFQSHNLLTEHTALSNVAVPVRMAGAKTAVAEGRAAALLKAVGLGHRLTHQPGELSGGEQQRVALARALVMGPGLILADEPTGNLDPRTAAGVFDLMLQLNAQLGSTLIVVTHSMELARRFPRRLRLHEGRFHEA